MSGPPQSRLDGRVIVVTGAASGQGAAEAELLASEGATVLALDRDVSWARAASPSARILRREHDVAAPEDWEALGAEVGERLGRVDGLINNAGVTSRIRLADVALEEWDRVLRINVTGAMLGIQALLRFMPEGASIVNVGSVAALGAHYTAAYTTSKWALRGLSQVAAMELGPRGIRVNAVHPGFIETPMTESAPAAFREANVGLTPLGRGGQPREVAALVLFLMSDASSFITGTDIPVDGGYSSGASAKAISDALGVNHNPTDTAVAGAVAAPPGTVIEVPSAVALRVGQA